MELELIRIDLMQVLKKKRYRHSVGVEEVSHDLALIHGCDPNKAILAGILHDCAKCQPEEELLNECIKHGIIVTDIEKRCPFLLHAKVGAFYAKNKYGIQDEEILSAITFHTTGRPAMSLLEKIVFTADYIEPFRKPLPRIDEIRQAAYNDIDLAVYLITENVLIYLQNNGNEIDSFTFDTYEYYRHNLQNRQNDMISFD